MFLFFDLLDDLSLVLLTFDQLVTGDHCPHFISISTKNCNIFFSLSFLLRGSTDNRSPFYLLSWQITLWCICTIQFLVWIARMVNYFTFLLSHFSNFLNKKSFIPPIWRFLTFHQYWRFLWLTRRIWKIKSDIQFSSYTKHDILQYPPTDIYISVFEIRQVVDFKIHKHV